MMPSILIPTSSTASDRVSDSQDSAHTQSSTAVSSLPTLLSSHSQSPTTSFADYDIAASPPASAAARQSSALTADAVSHPQHTENAPSLPPPATLASHHAHARLPLAHERPSTPPSINAVSNRSDSVPTHVSETSPVSGASSLSPVRGIKRAANGAPKTLMSPISPPSTEEHHVPYSLLPEESPRRIRAKQAVERMQLKLRLAQFKVNHGLQHKTMDEIDEMIAPMPTYSPVFYAHDHSSPPASLRGAARHTRNMSSITSTTDLMRGLHTASHPQYHQRYASLDSSRPEPLLAPPPDLASAPQSRPYSRVSTPTPREQEALESLMQMATPTASIFPAQARHGS